MVNRRNGDSSTGLNYFEILTNLEKTILRLSSSSSRSLSILLFLQTTVDMAVVIKMESSSKVQQEIQTGASIKAELQMENTHTM